MKKLLSLILTVVLLLSVVPVGAFSFSVNAETASTFEIIQYRYREKIYTTSIEELSEPWVLYNQKEEEIHGQTVEIFLEDDEIIDTSKYCVHYKSEACKYAHKTLGTRYKWVLTSKTHHSYYYDYDIYEDLWWHYTDGYQYTCCLNSSKSIVTRYYYYQWGEWSEWSELPISATDDVEVETRAVPLFTITYDANGGFGAPDTITKEFDKTITISETIPTRENHQFLGWSTTSEGDVEYVAGDEYSANENVTLYAVWKNVTEYTVTYDANGGSSAPAQQSKKHGESITLSSEIPTREGYTFLGWSTEIDNEAEYAPGSIYSTNVDIVLYAIWEKNAAIIASGVCGDNVFWTFYDDGELKIYGLGEMYDYEFSPPWEYYNIYSVKIESGVTHIGNYAFHSQGYLENVTISDSILSIGAGAFSGCSSITSVFIPDGVTIIKSHAFNECINLLNVSIPKSVKIIENETFYMCNSLTDVYIEDLSSWCNIEFGSIYSNPLKYAEYLHLNDEIITTLVIPENVMQIGAYAFCGFSGITSVEIPNNVIEIGYSAFRGNTGITNIFIPSSVTNIGEYAFLSCSSLVSIDVSEENQNYASINGHLFNKEKSCFIQYARGNIDTTYTIPIGVEIIHDSALYWCIDLESIAIPRSVTTIGAKAFSSCKKMEVIYFEGTYEEWITIKKGEYWDKNTGCDTVQGTYKLCCNCGETHYWDDGVITVEPTHISLGVKTFTCLGCGTTKTEDVAKLTEHAYGKWQRYSDDQHLKSCECGDVIYVDHNWNDGVMMLQPTHTTFGVRKYTCQDCSATKTEQIAKTTEHTYGLWAKVDDKSHRRTCACGKIDTASHNWDDGTITTHPTHTTFGVRSYTCQDCSATKTEQVAKTTKHSYGSWTNVDDEKHKHTCACGDIEIESHNYDNACDTNCNVCGYVRTVSDHIYYNTCDTTCNMCGAERSITHTYSNACDSICNICEATRTVPDHVYDNSCDTTCNECGAVRSITHTYSNNCDADCNVCGATRIAASHRYLNNCDTTCEICGAEREITHSYSNACDSICNICEATRAVPDHVYTNACDTTCNECYATRSITHTYSNNCDAECNICGATRTPSEHIYDNTCDTSCNECGAVRSITHTYSNNCDAECNVCGATRTPSAHVYDHIYDVNCNVCGAAREAAPLKWEISVSKTGVYSLKPNSKYTGVFSTDKIIVSDKNGNAVKYNESKGGFPLVVDQDYTIKFNYDCSDDINGTVTWTKTRKAETIFSDVSASEWYNNAIMYAVGRGIINGYGGTNNFGPGDNIQRQDFMVILAKLDGVDLTKYGNKTSAFSDVPEGSYFEAAVNWGAEKGIVNGYANGKFGTGDKITREQLVTFLYRYIKYQNGGTAPTVSANAEQKAKEYADYNGVADFAKEAVIWALDKGVIKGQGGTNIAPGGNALRCEVAQIMYNIFLNDIF